MFYEIIHLRGNLDELNRSFNLMIINKKYQNYLIFISFTKFI